MCCKWSEKVSFEIHRKFIERCRLRIKCDNQTVQFVFDGNWSAIWWNQWTAWSSLGYKVKRFCEVTIHMSVDWINNEIKYMIERSKCDSQQWLHTRSVRHSTLTTQAQIQSSNFWTNSINICLTQVLDSFSHGWIFASRNRKSWSLQAQTK